MSSKCCRECEVPPGVPRIHDSSATTLRGVLSASNVSDQHGLTPQLRIAELEAYLMSFDGRGSRQIGREV